MEENIENTLANDSNAEVNVNDNLAQDNATADSGYDDQTSVGSELLSDDSDTYAAQETATTTDSDEDMYDNPEASVDNANVSNNDANASSAANTAPYIDDNGATEDLGIPDVPYDNANPAPVANNADNDDTDTDTSSDSDAIYEPAYTETNSATTVPDDIISDPDSND